MRIDDKAEEEEWDLDGDSLSDSGREGGGGNWWEPEGEPEAPVEEGHGPGLG